MRQRKIVKYTPFFRIWVYISKFFPLRYTTCYKLRPFFIIETKNGVAMRVFSVLLHHFFHFQLSTAADEHRTVGTMLVAVIGCQASSALRLTSGRASNFTSGRALS
jgi:hypothetical protein